MCLSCNNAGSSLGSTLVFSTDTFLALLYVDQQTEHGDQWPGFFTFTESVFEESTTPLLDLQAKPNLTKDYRGGTLTSFVGLHSVTINEVMWVDSANVGTTNYIKNYPAISNNTGGNAVGVVSVNCSVKDCGIDGLFMTSSSSSMGAAGGGAPALRIFEADHATGVTLPRGGPTKRLTPEQLTTREKTTRPP